MDEIGLLTAVDNPPFVVTVGGDQTAALSECVAEVRFFVYAFGLGVDRLQFCIFSPVGDESPMTQR